MSHERDKILLELELKRNARKQKREQFFSNNSQTSQSGSNIQRINSGSLREKISTFRPSLETRSNNIDIRTKQTNSISSNRNYFDHTISFGSSTLPRTKKVEQPVPSSFTSQSQSPLYSTSAPKSTQPPTSTIYNSNRDSSRLFSSKVPHQFPKLLPANPFSEFTQKSNTNNSSRTIAVDASIYSDPIPLNTKTFSSVPTRQYSFNTKVQTINSSVGIKSPIPSTKFHLITKSTKKGYAIIFNQEYFKTDIRQTTRAGTNNDVTSLQKTLEKFNIEIVIKNNLTLDAIDKEVSRLKYFNFKLYQCFIIVILSHGNRNDILYAFDGEYNLDDKIVNPIIFTNTSLAGKPKILFIQACKGNGPAISFMETDSSPVKSTKVPAHLNLFYAYATYEGFVSYRNTLTGGVFIQKLCEILSRDGFTEPLHKIMERITDELSKNNLSQVPTIKSTMTKSFCFGDIGK